MQQLVISPLMRNPVAIAHKCVTKDATTVLANFRQLAGEKQIRIHPIVGRLIDPAVLEKLKLASAETATKQPQAPMGEARGNA